MATQNHITINRTFALNMVDLLTVKNEKKVKKHQRNAHYVEATILPGTNAVKLIIT